MRAALFAGVGGPEVIEVADVPAPVAADGEILVRVAAAGLNRADVGQRSGVYPPPPGASDVPGLEVSGTIAARGGGVSAADWPDGAEVCALLAGGGYAEYVAVPTGQAMRVPPTIDLVTAAGIPEVATTVVSNLNGAVRVEPGQWALVHGGSGGIGSFAIQYLRQRGVHVIATASSLAKRSWAEQRGAVHTIDYTTEDFADRVLEITDGRGVDAVLDVVGARYLADNIRALATGGRLVIIALGGGRHAEIDLGALLAKRAGVIATTLRSRPDHEKAQFVASVAREVLPLIEDGTIRVDIDRTFELDDAAEAHEYFDSGAHQGKVLLTVNS